MRRIIIGVSRHVEYDLRNDFFAHLQLLPLSYFQSRRTGDLMSRATNDLNAVRMTMGPAVMYSANTLILFVAAIGLMLSIDVRLTLVALIPLPFVSIAREATSATAIHKRFERIQAQLSDLSAVTQEALSGVRVVRAYGQEEAETGAVRAGQPGVPRAQPAARPAPGALLPEHVAVPGPRLAARALARQPRGDCRPADGRRLRRVQRLPRDADVADDGVRLGHQHGAARPGVVDADARGAGRRARLSRTRRRAGWSVLPEVAGAIEFRDLTFAYGTPPVLDRVSVRIEAGQTVALVGPTGSGKSTLISLLPRLFDPPPGTVFVDGVDVRDLALAQLRGAIGFVPQEAFLFSESIADNIAFGAGGAAAADRARIAWAAGVARLDKDVADFPNGLDTMVGERGITLSGGQKQRAAIARALMTDPRILVLDDALSAVDTYTEEEILERLRAVMRERTSIIVSHRVSTVRHADLILVLVEGRLIERGTHDELVRLDGFYAELYRKQLLEEELAAS